MYVEIVDAGGDRDGVQNGWNLDGMTVLYFGDIVLGRIFIDFKWNFKWRG